MSKANLLGGSVLILLTVGVSSCGNASLLGNTSTAKNSASGGSSALTATGNNAEAIPAGSTGSGSGSGGTGSSTGSGSGGLGGVLGNIVGQFCVSSGSAAPATATSAPASSSAPVATSNGSGSGSGGLSPSQKAIAQCLKNWGNAPFTTSSPYSQIAASVSVFGMGDAVVDNTNSSTPQLVLIDAAVSVLGSPKYQLMDPNGWYCLVSDTNVLSNVTINLVQGAHLSDTSVGVDVLGSNSGQGAGNVNVNVLSCESVVVVPPG